MFQTTTRLRRSPRATTSNRTLCLLQRNLRLSKKGAMGFALWRPDVHVQLSSDTRLLHGVVPGRHETNKGRMMCPKLSYKFLATSKVATLKTDYLI